MIIDLVAPDSYLMINKRAIQIFGLNTAAYLSVIFNIGKTVVRKKKFNPEGWFTVDRKFVQSEIAIKPADQIVIDKSLANVGVIEQNESDYNTIRIHANIFEQIITDTDTKAAKATTAKLKSGKIGKAESRREYIIQMLCDTLTESDPDIRQAKIDLISVIYDKGFCKKVQVECLENDLNNYSADKQIKLALLKKMMINAWKDVAWAIKAYEDEQRKGSGKWKRTVEVAKPECATADSVDKNIKL